jgi:hypothetical protein
MLSGWAGLQNGPLVPEAITKVTSFGTDNRRLRCARSERPRTTKDTRVHEEDPTQDGFPLWNSCPSWFMPLREAALGKGFRVFGLHDCANNCTAFYSCLLKPRYRCFELWYGACILSRWNYGSRNSRRLPEP